MRRRRLQPGQARCAPKAMGVGTGEGEGGENWHLSVARAQVGSTPGGPRPEGARCPPALPRRPPREAGKSRREPTPGGAARSRGTRRAAAPARPPPGGMDPHPPGTGTVSLPAHQAQPQSPLRPAPSRCRAHEGSGRSARPARTRSRQSQELLSAVRASVPGRHPTHPRRRCGVNAARPRGGR